MKKKIAAMAAASLMLLAACGSDESTSDTSTTVEAPAEAGTIAEVASANDDFSTLVAALDAADLVETLSGAGPFTVFAPTNAAFDALPEGLVEKLLLPENKEVLVAILTYHVVAGKVMAADVKAGDVASVQGENITIDTASGVKVNTANVTTTDVAASNGVIHVIDAVITKPASPNGVSAGNSGVAASAGTTGLLLAVIVGVAILGLGSSSVVLARSRRRD